jgi:hypothetical protein
LLENTADFDAVSECRFEHSANMPLIVPLIVDSQDLPVYRRAQYQSQMSPESEKSVYSSQPPFPFYIFTFDSPKEQSP